MPCESVHTPSFFHILLCCCLMLNCFKLPFSTSIYTPCTILTKQKHNCHNFGNVLKINNWNNIAEVFIPLTKYLAEAPLQSQVFFVWCDKLCSSAFGNYLPFFSSFLLLSSSVRLDGGRCTFSDFSRNICLGSIPGCGWATQGHSQSCL